MYFSILTILKLNVFHIFSIQQFKKLYNGTKFFKQINYQRQTIQRILINRPHTIINEVRTQQQRK